MCQGISRLRYREGYEKIKLVIPGEILKISIDMFGTGQQYETGHRVRLEVTSSAFPSAAPNYNTGGSMWEENDSIIATQTVFHSKKYPSHLILSEIATPKFSEAWTETRWS
jgi:predicted acyl esterase